MIASAHANPIYLRGTDTGGSDYGYMFPELAADAGSVLPEGPKTIAALRDLGAAMTEVSSSEPGPVPAVMTYFGQFIDHDVTSTFEDDPDRIAADDFPVFTARDIRHSIRNRRTAHLDLDSLYEGAAIVAADGSMPLGRVAPGGEAREYQDLDFDLPRRPARGDRGAGREGPRDREALIGDPRNDENLLVAQLHVAFLRAHNRLLARDYLSPAQARRALRRRYQLAVLHDYLAAVCDREVLQRVLTHGPEERRRITDRAELFMPLEFAHAAFRFGHSMIRGSYPVNVEVGEIPIATLFALTAFSGRLVPPSRGVPVDSLPARWVVDWNAFFGPDGARARRIDSLLVPELSQLADRDGGQLPGVLAQLATRDLLRGYRFGLPTGQAVARALGEPPLEGPELCATLPDAVAGSLGAGGFLKATPLWLYLLAEAGDPRAGAPNGAHLGRVGSTIVAETFWNLIRNSHNSVIADPPDEQEIPAEERTLEGIVRLGGKFDHAGGRW